MSSSISAFDMPNGDAFTDSLEAPPQRVASTRFRCHRTPTGPRRGGGKGRRSSTGRRKKGTSGLVIGLAIGAGVLLLGVAVTATIYMFSRPTQAPENVVVDGSATESPSNVESLPGNDQSLAQGAASPENSSGESPPVSTNPNEYIRISNARIGKNLIDEAGLEVDFTNPEEKSLSWVKVMARMADGEMRPLPTWATSTNGVSHFRCDPDSRGMAAFARVRGQNAKDLLMNWDAVVELYCIVDQPGQSPRKVSNSLTFGANSSGKVPIRRLSNEEEAVRKAYANKVIAERNAARVIPEGYFQVTVETSLMRGTQLKAVDPLGAWSDVEVLDVRRRDPVLVHEHGTNSKWDRTARRSELIISQRMLDLLATQPDYIPTEIAQHENVVRPSSAEYPVDSIDLRNPDIPRDCRRVTINLQLEIGTPVKVPFVGDWVDAEIIDIDGPRMVTVRWYKNSKIEKRVNRTDLAILSKNVKK